MSTIASATKALLGDVRTNDRIRARRFDLLAAVVIVGAGTYGAWLIDQGYFFADDFLELNVGRVSRFTLSYLLRDQVGHLIPLTSAVIYLVARVYPYQFALVMTMSAVTFVALLASFYRLVKLICGTGWHALALTALLGASPILVAQIVWWCAALDYMTTGLFCILTIDGFLRYVMTRSKAQLAVSGVSFVLAVGFFDSSLLAFGVLVLLWLLFVYERSTDGLLRRALRRDWRMWCVYLVTLGLYFGYRGANAGKYALPKPPSLGLLVDYLRIAWGLGFSPAIVGVNYPYRLLLGSRDLTIVLAQVVVVGTMVLTVVIRRSAWRAWLLFVVAFFVELVAAGYARVSARGTVAGLYYDYMSLGPILFLLAIAIVVRGGKIRPSEVTAPTGRSAKDLLKGVNAGRRWGVTPALGSVGVAFLTVSVLALGIPSGVSMAMASTPYQETEVQTWPYAQTPRASRLYFDNLAKSQAREIRHDPGGKLYVYDGEIPNGIAPSFFYPSSLDSQTVGHVDPGLKFNARIGDSYLISSSGQLLPASLDLLAKVSLARPHYVHYHTHIWRSDDRLCLSSSSSGTVVFPLAVKPAITPGSEPLALVSYRSIKPLRSGASVSLTMGGVAAVTATGMTSVPIVGSHSTMLLDLPPVGFGAITLRASSSTSLCISSMEIVLPVPTSGDQE